MLCISHPPGGPGCGKGTQCDKIKAKYGYKHLSAGDLLREEVASGSPRGKELNEIMKEVLRVSVSTSAACCLLVHSQGKLVPVDVTLGLLRAAIDKLIRQENAKRFLVDGFPRELDQAIEFEKLVCCRTNLGSQLFT